MKCPVSYFHYIRPNFTMLWSVALLIKNVLKCYKNCSQESGKRTCLAIIYDLPYVRSQPPCHGIRRLGFVKSLHEFNELHIFMLFHFSKCMRMHPLTPRPSEPDTPSHTHTHTKRAIWSAGIVLPLVVWALPWSRLFETVFQLVHHPSVRRPFALVLL